jgi:hypothetical protein
VFSINDEVFLKLQPYLQSLVQRRVNQKLAFKYFGPFRVLARVCAVAYKLELPETSRVHSVLHFSQFKPCLRPGQQVLPQLPPPDTLFQFLYAYSRGGLVNKVYALSFKSWCSGVVRRNPWPPGRIWIHFDRNFLELLLEDKQKIKKKGMSANWGRPPTSDPGRQGTEASSMKRSTRPTRSIRLPGWLTGYQLGRRKKPM